MDGWRVGRSGRGPGGGRFVVCCYDDLVSQI